LLAALTLSCADVHDDVPPAGTVGGVVDVGGAIVVTGTSVVVDVVDDEEDDVEEDPVEEEGALVGCDDALGDL